MKGLNEEVGSDLYFWRWDPFRTENLGSEFLCPDFLDNGQGDGAFG
jgi:hypothetical protein